MILIAYPWFFLLLPLPLIVRYVLPTHHEHKAAVRVPFMQRLAQLGGQPTGARPARGRSKTQWAILSLSWCLLVLALARPQWLQEPLIKELPMRDLLLAVDLSGSMETADFSDKHGKQIDRLSAVKQVLDDFLQQRDGDRIGLILFASAAFVQVPFTADLDVVRELLQEAQLRMLGPRTMIGDAMGLAINQFERSEVEDRVLILLTDGNDTGSLIPPERAAEIAKDNGVVIHTIAIGNPGAAGEQALDEVSLSAIASITGGQYFHANDTAELNTIYQYLDKINPKQVETLSYRPVSDLYYWPLGIALMVGLLALLFLDLRRRFRASRSATSTTPASPAEAH